MLTLSLYTFLFKECNKYYLYNSQTNFLSEISIEMYNLLCDREWGKLPEEVLYELRLKKIIVSEDCLYDYYNYENIKFNCRNYNPLSLSLVIAPTTGCNFACPYCFEPKQNPKTITSEIISKIGEFIKSHTDAKYLDLTWYGGEPLLAFAQIKELWKELTASNMPKIINHSIITNGYLFNTDVINFFKTTNLNHIQITLDGTETHHNTTRYTKNKKCPTFNQILKNIDLISTYLPEAQLDIRININKNNYADFISLYHYFKQTDPDNKKIVPYPGLIREETTDKCSLCNKSYSPKELVDLFKIFNQNGINTSLFPRRKYKGCMVHSMNSYIIGPEGELYKCWNDVSNPNSIIGNIGCHTTEINSRFIKFMNQATPFNPVCRECSVFPLCDGGCSYHRYKNMFSNGKYELCCSYKDVHILKQALVNGEISDTFSE